MCWKLIGKYEETKFIFSQTFLCCLLSKQSFLIFVIWGIRVVCFTTLQKWRRGIFLMIGSIVVLVFSLLSHWRRLAGLLPLLLRKPVWEQTGPPQLLSVRARRRRGQRSHEWWIVNKKGTCWADGNTDLEFDLMSFS